MREEGKKELWGKTIAPECGGGQRPTVQQPSLNRNLNRNPTWHPHASITLSFAKSTNDSAGSCHRAPGDTKSHKKAREKWHQQRKNYISAPSVTINNTGTQNNGVFEN